MTEEKFELIKDDVSKIIDIFNQGHGEYKGEWVSFKKLNTKQSYLDENKESRIDHTSIVYMEERHPHTWKMSYSFNYKEDIYYFSITHSYKYYDEHLYLKPYTFYDERRNFQDFVKCLRSIQDYLDKSGYIYDEAEMTYLINKIEVILQED